MRNNEVPKPIRRRGTLPFGFFNIADPFAANNAQDYTLFEKIFRHWADAFNHKDLAGSCRLFAKNMVADYKGAPQKNYASICNSFKKIFAEPNHSYQYHFKLHNVYRSGNLAALRITWYLAIYEHGKLVSTIKDEGLDVFAKDSNAQWKIINYLGYPTDKE